jgi:hypothetical protein
MKPSFYICGGGSPINCDQWDDVNGCWQDQNDAWLCRKFILLDSARDDADMNDGVGGY